MTIIDAKHQFIRKRNLYIAELMAQFDTDDRICDYSVDYIGDNREERYQVRVSPYKSIDFINLEYEIITDDSY